MTPTTEIPLPSPAYLANSRWVQANWEQLVQRYPDQWIAVDQGRVLAADANRGRVADRAQQISSSPDILYEFVATSSMIFHT